MLRDFRSRVRLDTNELPLCSKSALHVRGKKDRNGRREYYYMNIAIAVQGQLTLTPFAIIGSCERSQFFRAISVLKHFVR